VAKRREVDSQLGKKAEGSQQGNDLCFTKNL